MPPNGPATHFLAAELLAKRRVGNDREVVLSEVHRAARRRALADHAQHRVLDAADADLLADRIEAAEREQRLVRAVADDGDVAGARHFLFGERAARVHLGKVDLDVLLGGAHDRRQPRPLAPVEHALHARRSGPAAADPDVDHADGGGLPLDRVHVVGGDQRPPHQLEERRPRRKAEAAEALHEDRVRAERVDRVAERRVEAANQRGHADDRHDADHHAEHGQGRAHLVGAERVERHFGRFAQQRELFRECRHRLLAPQRLDRVEHRGPPRRHPAEEQPDGGGDQDAQRHRPQLHRRRHRRQASR